MSELGAFVFGDNKDFVRFFDQRKHIWIERMDNKDGVKAVQAWIDCAEMKPADRTNEESASRYKFLFHHIRETSPIFTWYFKETMFTQPE